MDRTLQKQYDELLRKVVAALANYNLSKVARATGLHENTVRNIANGSRPAIETLETLADFLFGSR